MKSILFFIAFSLSFGLLAQDTSTSVERLNDSTFVQTNVTTYADGRTVTETIPYTIDEFANLVVDQNIENLIQIAERERLNTIKQRDVNSLKNYLVDSLAVSYDSLLAEKLLLAIPGDWKLLKRQNGTDTWTDVNIARHATVPTVLRMANITAGSGGWNIKNISTHTWQINQYNTGTVTENVEMTLTLFANFTGYRGVATDGTVLILRR